ncbi:MAG: cysteine desulfurase NifS, partial [Waddliaceae bacterium]
TFFLKTVNCQVNTITEHSIQPHLAASTGSACTSGIPEPSHVLKAINLSDQEIEASIRFSLGRGTTIEDLDESTDILKQALSKLEKVGLAQGF